MKNQKFAWLLVTVFVFNHTLFSQNTTLTLQQCVETAIANNLDTRQSELLSESAAANVKQAKAGRLPNLSMDINHGANQGRSIDPFTNSYINQDVSFANYGLNGSIVLFSGNNITNNIRQNQYTHEATKMDFQQAKDNLTLRVILAYLQVLSNEDQLAQNENQAALSKKQVERLDILNSQGAVTPSQLYDLQGQLANDQIAIINSQNAVDGAKLSLCQLMNIPYDENLQLQRLDSTKEVKLYDASTRMIYESAAKQLGFVKATEFRKLSAEKALKASKGLMFPTVYVSGGLYTNYSSVASTAQYINSVEVPNGDYISVAGNKVPVITTQNNYQDQKIPYFDQFTNNYNTSIMLGVRIPILNGLQIRTRITQAKINLKNADLVESTTKLQLQQQVEQAYFNMNAAYKKFNKLQEQHASFAESFRIAEVRFDAGAINSVEYLVVKNNLDRTNINLIVARYEYLLRTKVLDYYQGKALW
jgi:outer membrane protein